MALDGCGKRGFSRAFHSLTKDGWAISRSFFARYGIPLMLTVKCVR
jgi:hypothetical protein